MKVEQKGKKLLALILALTMCLTMLPQNAYADEDTTGEPAVVAQAEEPAVEEPTAAQAEEPAAGEPAAVEEPVAEEPAVEEPTAAQAEEPAAVEEPVTPTSEGAVDIETLRDAAQAAIDALPDTTAEGFSVTAENVDGFKEQLTDANNAIMSFMQAGGNDSQLDLTKFDALTAAVTNYDGGISTMAAGNVADDCPWFTAESVKALFADENFATVVYDTVHNASESDFDCAWDSVVYRFPITYDGHVINNYNSLVQYINGTAWSAAEKTALLLHFFTGKINASGKGIQSIEGIKQLTDADINLSNNKIQSLEPIAFKPGDPPMFSNGIDFTQNPIHVWPPYLGAVSGSSTYRFDTSVSVVSDQTFRYHFGDEATASVTLDVSNAENGDIWNPKRNDWINDPKQSSVSAFTVNLDTISGKAATFEVQTSQETPDNDDPDPDPDMDDKVMGVYATNYKWDNGWEAYMGDYQHNTFSYDYSIATQLYAGVKQTATVEVLGGFTFTKTNEAGDKTLPGAEYELYDEKNQKITTRYNVDSDGVKTEVSLSKADLTTDENGQIRMTYLPSGSYYLKEVKAPSGYSINSDKVAVTIDGASATTGIEGGIPSFMQSSSSVSMDPAWETSYTKGIKLYAFGKTNSGAETMKTAANYDSEVLLTNKTIYGWTEKDGTQSFNSSAVASDYNTISTLKSELSTADAAKYDEKSTVTVEMQRWNKKTGDWSTTPTKTTYTSLAAAKEGINTYADNNGLTGDITVTSNTVYLLKDTEVAANAVSQKDKEAVLSANLNLTALKALDGANKYLADGQYKFELKQTGAPEGVSPLIPESGVVGYNKADGSISFDTMLSFAKAGTYTFTLQEDPTYRKTGLTDADYQGIVFDDAVRTITVVVEEADRTGSEPQSFNAVVSVAKGNEAAVEVGTVAGADTNTVDADQTITPKPVDVGVGTVDNQLQKPEANLSATKTVDMGTLVDDEFTFSLVPGADCKDVTYLDDEGTEHPLPANGWTALTNKADGTIDFDAAFSALVFPKEQTTYHFTLSENDTPDGSVYNKDTTSVPITVTVTRNTTTGKYEAAVSYDEKATAPTFENTFKRTTLTASKVVAAGGSATDDFEFTLTFDAGTSGLTLPATGIAGITVGAGNTATITKVNGTAASTIGATDPVLSVTYTVKGGQQLALAGVPVGLGYTVSETAHSLYYANTDKTGTVEAGGSSVSVSNQVKTGDVYVSKAVTGLHSSADDSFTFTMDLAVANGYSWVKRTYNISQDGGVTWGNDVAVDADATQISFNLKDGWMARVNELPIGTYTTVETEDPTYTSTSIPTDGKVTLTNENIITGGKVDFTNAKKDATPTKISLKAVKTVDGKVPETVTTGYAGGVYTTTAFDQAFAFKLENIGTLPAGAGALTNGTQTDVRNDAAGAVSFAEIGNLSAAGTYYFKMTETSTGTSYVGVDSSVYIAAVEVAYNSKEDSGNTDYTGAVVTAANSLYVKSITWTKDRAIVAESTNKDNAAAFDNTQKGATPTSATLDVTKTLDGKAPAADKFSFTISADDGVPMPKETTVKNKADGTVSFGEISYEKAGVYQYIIKENASDDKKVKTDARTYTVTVTVVDNGTNTNTLKVDSITYAASEETDVNGNASASTKAAFVNRTYEVGYAMAKFRTMDADQFGTEVLYGFKPGQKDVTYQIAVANTGELPLTMDVTDVFTTGATNFENVKVAGGTGYKGVAFKTTAEAKLADITAIMAGTSDADTKVNSIDGAKANVTIQPGSTIVLKVTADVKIDAEASLDDTAADDDKNPKKNKDGYTNTATASEVKATYTGKDKDGKDVIVELTKDDFLQLDLQSDTAQTPVQLKPGYAMAKFRTMDADQFGTEDLYGFKPGQEGVTYQIAVANTGELPLTMDVTDVFTTGADNFENVKVVGGIGYQGVAFQTTAEATRTKITTIETFAKNVDTKVNRRDGATANVTIQPKSTIVLLVTADVKSDAKASLDDTKADDNANPKTNNDGYTNTATVSNVTGTYTTTVGGEEKTTTITEEKYPELKPQDDTAQTPVQPKPGYAMAKFRTLDADQFGTEAHYGFKPGQKGVTYQIAVANTGELPLTMDVTDVFTTGATNFENVKVAGGTGYKGVAFKTTAEATLADITAIMAGTSDADTKVNSIDGAKANVTIQPGSTIVLEVTADVKIDAKASLDDTAADDDKNPKKNKDGYTNTATASNVTGTYTTTVGGEEKTTTVTEKEYPELKPQDDTAQTPVQENLKPECTLSATKSVDLGTLVDDEFSFSLIPGADYKDVTCRATAGGEEQPLPTGGWTLIMNKDTGAVDFAAAFSSLVFPKEAKTYQFTLKENDIPAGSSYNKDAIEYEVTITVAKDANGLWKATPSYRNKSMIPIITGAPEFKNTFKRAPLQVSKNVSSEAENAKDEFTFTVTLDAGTSGLSVPVKGIVLAGDNTAKITKVNNAAATTITADTEITSITYTVKAGQKLSLEGIPVGMGYTVHEDENPRFFANADRTGTITGDGANISLVNQLKTGAIYVAKNVAGLYASSDDEFAFTMTLNIAEGDTWINRTYNISTDGGVTWGEPVTVDPAATSISFTLMDGWTARVNELPIGTYTTVETADPTYTAASNPADGVVTLTEENRADGGRVEFINTKNAPAPTAVTLKATKTVDGIVPETVTTGYAGGVYTTTAFDQAFAFKLENIGTLPAGAGALTNGTQTEVRNDAAGAVNFAEIGNLSAAGTYYFKMTETTGGTAYVGTDSGEYTAAVEVAYNSKEDSGNTDYTGTVVTTANSLYVKSITWTKDGAIVAESTNKDNAAAFDNTQKGATPTSATLNVTKTLDGKTPAADKFSFTISAADGVPMPAETTVKNKADGTVPFGEIAFDRAGVYEYTILENAPDDKSVKLDTRTYKATVTVVDDGTNTNTVQVASITYAASEETDGNGAASATDKAAFINRTYGVGYAVAKFRTMDADKFGTENVYGFKPGTTGVTYKIAVANTGELPLTMDVTDAFTTGTSYFENVAVVGGTGYKGVAFKTTAEATLAAINGIEAGEVDAATTVNSTNGATANVTIQPGSTIVLLVTADVKSDAKANLDDTAADDSTNVKSNKDGYTNTATAGNVTGTYTTTVNGEEQTTTVTETDYPEELKPQKDTAQTPVQPKSGYAIAKFRTMDAPKMGTDELYGFKPGQKGVTYKIAVANTGELPLTMDVTDAFTTGTSYFENITVVSGTGCKGVAFQTTAEATLAKITAIEAFIKDEKTTLNSTDGATANVTIQPGSTIVLLVTADIKVDAEESLDDTAADDVVNPKKNRDGYTNTATASDVTGTYTTTVNGEEKTTTVTEREYPDELKPQNDTAQTPVQGNPKPECTLSATKSVDLGTLVDDEFSFSLIPGADYKDVTYRATAGGEEQPLPTGGWTLIMNKNTGAVDFAAAFSSLVFPKEAKTYQFTLKENDIPAGSSYNKDATEYEVTITVAKDANGLWKATPTYRNKSMIPIITGAPEFKNTFKRAPLQVSKNVSSEAEGAEDGFTFTVTLDAGISGLTVPVKGITLAGDNSAVITGINGAAATTITADTEITSITYTVTAGQKLSLEGIPVGMGYTVHEDENSRFFVNTDRTGTITADGVNISLVNQLKTGAVYVAKNVAGLYASTDDEFTFTMDLNIAEGDAWINRTYNISTDGGVTWGDPVSVAADTTSIEFKLKDGWAARVNELPIGTYTTVETADPTYLATSNPADGVVTLTEENRADGGRVEFTNTKNAPAPTAVTLKATKMVDGTVPETITTGYADGVYTTTAFDQAFAFKLENIGTLPAGAGALINGMQTEVRNDAAGAVNFAEIGNLSAAGTYYFKMTETTGGTAYVGTDSGEYIAAVEVAYNGRADSGNTDYTGAAVTAANSLYVKSITWTKGGVAVADSTNLDGAAAFNNTQRSAMPTSATLNVTKSLDGMAPAADQFSFTISAADGVPMPAETTVKNKSDGTVPFGEIKYDQAGEYQYTVQENASDDVKVITDARTYTVTVKVVDDGTDANTLKVESITYLPSAETDVNGAASATDKAAFINRTYGVGYAIAKFRTMDADKISTEDLYGFNPGTTGVNYKIAVANKGELPLTMDVTDVFTTGTGYFENVTVVSGTGYKGVAFQTTAEATLAAINGIEAGEVDAATIVNSTDGATANVTIQPGSTIVLVVTADIKNDAEVSLEETAADDSANVATHEKGEDKESNKANVNGYTNTVTTSNVTGTYTTIVNGEEKTIVVTEKEFPEELKSQDDTAQTPVQPNPQYEMSKTRISLAPERKGTDKYGFFRGDTVTYAVEVRNTGNIDLTMDVADAFTDAAYFSAPEAIQVSGEGVTSETKLPTKESVKVTIPAGKTATILFTAVVQLETPENISNAAEDDGLGYLNTATTTNVTGNYSKPDGSEASLDKSNDPKLEDQMDTANTPVQVTEGTSFAPSVTKEIKGDTPGKKDPFTFKIAGETGREPMPSKDTLVIQGAGTGLFNPISYTEEGTWNYTVTEVEGTDAHYTYDKTVYKMKVTVEEKEGHLEATVTINEKNGVTTMKFVNTYKKDKTIVSSNNLTNNKLTNNKLTNNKLTGGAKTGDTSVGLALYIMLILISGVVIVMTARRRRREER